MASAPRSAITLFRLGALFALLANIGGAVVAATHSGFECGDWPGCTADALLPGGVVNELLYRNPWIEMIHRTSAALTTPTVLIAAIVGVRLRGVHPLVRILPWFAVVGALIAGFVGRGLVLGETYPMWVSALDLTAAQVTMASMVIAAIALERAPVRWSVTRVGVFGWGALGSLYLMHVAGLYGAGPNSYTRVVSWPVWRILDADLHGSLAAQWLRFPLAALAAVLIVLAIREACARGTAPVARTVAGVLMAVCLASGAVIAFTATDALGVPMAVSAVGLLFTLLLIAGRASLHTIPWDEEPTSPQAEAPARQAS
ncbi:MAG: hypothetical protein QM708_05140 [Propioniciclava sp.]|uniref:hypothetical protein n=1 Tax=Propioniciclava sp. TaxID=2038686 RepID=UPI0039E37EE8